VNIITGEGKKLNGTGYPARFFFGIDMNKSSLRRQRVLPYVLLVLFVSAAISWVSYGAGEKAIDTLSQKMSQSIVDRIDKATERQLAGALNEAYPDLQIVPKPQAFSDDLKSLETRLWVGGGLSTEFTATFTSAARMAVSLASIRLARIDRT